MKINLMKMVSYIFLGFILLVFIAGNLSEQIQESLLPEVDIFYTNSIDEIPTTVNFEGTIKAAKTYVSRLPYDISIGKWFVKEGEQIQENQALFEINHKDQLLVYRDEKERLDLEYQSLLQAYQGLDHQSNGLSLIEADIKSIKSDIVYYGLIEDKKKVEALRRDLSKKQLDLVAYIEKSLEEDFSTLKNRDQVQLQIDQVLKQIDLIKIKEDFYSRMGDDGIYYAPSSGIITDIKGDYVKKDQVVCVINDMSQGMIYTGYFDDDYSYLIQKKDLLYLELRQGQKPIEAKITKIYEGHNGQAKIQALVMSDQLLIGQNLSGRSKQRPASAVNVPRTAVLNKGVIKTGTRVELFCVVKEDGVLGKTSRLVKSYGTVAYVGDDYLGLSEKTLPSSFTPAIVNNPVPTLKAGDRITE